VPDRAPGFRATEQDHREVRELSARLFEGTGAPGHLVRDEKSDLPHTLAALLPPDVMLSPASPDIGFVHRHTSSAEIYFIANTSNTRQRMTATLRIPHAPSAPHAASAPNAFAPNGSSPNASSANASAAAEVWNAVDGTMTPADAHPTPDKRLAVSLDLDAYASRLIVIPHNASVAAAGARAPRAMTRRESIASPPIDISSGWIVTFGPHGQPVPMDHLHSWTDDESTRDFSGVATYERTVNVPPELLRGHTAITLDFGEAQPTGPREPNARMQAWLDPSVREAAVVYVNDRRIGSVWCPPYALDVTAALKPGDNRLRILVGNLAINGMSARALPDYRFLNLRYGVRFEPQDMDKVRPVPAGLLGPIRLVPSRTH
jgi:hypothetical protein